VDVLSTRVANELSCTMVAARPIGPARYTPRM
jgi:hypothetical protein